MFGCYFYGALGPLAICIDKFFVIGVYYSVIGGGLCLVGSAGLYAVAYAGGRGYSGRLGGRIRGTVVGTVTLPAVVG